MIIIIILQNLNIKGATLHFKIISLFYTLLYNTFLRHSKKKTGGNVKEIF